MTAETIRPGNDGSGRETGKFDASHGTKSLLDCEIRLASTPRIKPVKTAEEALYGP